MNFKTLTIALAISAPLVYGAHAGEVEDTAITAKVKATLLAENNLPATDLQVSTKDAVVKIDGKVATQTQADLIKDKVTTMGDVKDLDTSRLVVEDSEQYIRDSKVTTVVKARLLQLQTTDKKIGANASLHVETNNGTVHIRGDIKNAGDEQVIKDEIAKVADVKEVMTDLTVVS